MYKSTLPVLFLLLSSAAALTTYTDTAASADAGNYNTMSLGNLTATDVITFLMEFPNPATGAGPTTFYPELFDNTVTALSPQPSGFGSANAATINFNGSNTITWTVSTTGAYYLRILPPGLEASFVPYHLTVTNSNGGEILKVSDAIRSLALVLLYLASTQATYTINIGNGGPIGLNSQNADNTWAQLTPSSANISAFSFTNLPAGYYALQSRFITPGSFTFQSDSFPCPSSYDPNFVNNPQLYQACTYTPPTTPTTPTTTTGSGTTEDNSTRNRNIALIAVFSFVAVAGLIILIVFIAKKSAAAGASSAVAAANESSQVNI